MMNTTKKKTLLFRILAVATVVTELALLGLLIYGATTNLGNPVGAGGIADFVEELKDFFEVMEGMSGSASTIWGVYIAYGFRTMLYAAWAFGCLVCFFKSISIIRGTAAAFKPDFNVKAGDFDRVLAGKCTPFSMCFSLCFLGNAVSSGPVEWYVITLLVLGGFVKLASKCYRLYYLDGEKENEYTPKQYFIPKLVQLLVVTAGLVYLGVLVFKPFLESVSMGFIALDSMRSSMSTTYAYIEWFFDNVIGPFFTYSLVLGAYFMCIGKYIMGYQTRESKYRVYGLNILIGAVIMSLMTTLMVFITPDGFEFGGYDFGTAFRMVYNALKDFYLVVFFASLGVYIAGKVRINAEYAQLDAQNQNTPSVADETPAAVRTNEKAEERVSAVRQNAIDKDTPAAKRTKESGEETNVATKGGDGDADAITPMRNSGSVNVVNCGIPFDSWKGVVNAIDTRCAKCGASLTVCKTKKEYFALTCTNMLKKNCDVTPITVNSLATQFKTWDTESTGGEIFDIYRFACTVGSMTFDGKTVDFYDLM